MFKCDNCGKQTLAGEKTYTVNTVREKEYTHYRLIFDTKTRRKKKEFYTTTGYEPVTELHYCKDCYQGEIVDGDENGFRETNKSTERRGTEIKRRGQIDGINTRRIV